MTDYTVTTYTLYLILSIGLTIWVARTLSKHGRHFLVECFNRNAEMADSVNHLLVVGFYLMNIGFIALFLKLGLAVTTARGVFEALSGKVGVVLLVLGIMHFFNLFLLNRIRMKSKAARAALEAPPLPTA